MQSTYDIIIVGASSAGAYFAHHMAKRGFSVLCIEKDSRENLNRGYDIFHMMEHERKLYDLPEVKPEDGVYVFEYKDSWTFSPYSNYGKYGDCTVVGMHRHEYMLLMDDWATAAGAEILYEASYKSLQYTDGKISGVTFEYEEKEISCSCRLCVDCSGQAAVVRRSLPENYGIETDALTPKDLFFVKLRYVKFDDESLGKWMKSHFWIYYKTWLAPSDEENDCIIGIGASNSYDECDRIYEDFISCCEVPAHKVTRYEYGTTPYRRPIYSFVADGFMAFGDAAVLTKGNNGEGCTAQLALESIAVEIASEVMKNGAYPTRDALWPINKEYNKGQGKDFAFMYAAFAKAMRHSKKANEYMFAKNTIMSDKIIAEHPDGINLSSAEIAKMIYHIITGLTSKNILPSELGQILQGASNGVKLMVHYMLFPKEPSGFGKWVRKSDKLWKKAGQISD